MYCTCFNYVFLTMTNRKNKSVNKTYILYYQINKQKLIENFSK